jgi:hypothetical protein
MSAAASNPSAILAQLGVLEASSAFRESARHRRLLAFLVETTLKGEADGLKEFVIAAEVWDRNVSFDPRIHSMVRVEVAPTTICASAFRSAATGCSLIAVFPEAHLAVLSASLPAQPDDSSLWKSWAAVVWGKSGRLAIRVWTGM